MDSFRPFVIGLTLRRIEESLNVKLQPSSIKLVKELRYKDGDGDLAREFSASEEGPLTGRRS